MVRDRVSIHRMISDSFQAQRRLDIRSLFGNSPEVSSLWIVGNERPTIDTSSGLSMSLSIVQSAHLLVVVPYAHCGLVAQPLAAFTKVYFISRSAIPKPREISGRMSMCRKLLSCGQVGKEQMIASVLGSLATIYRGSAVIVEWERAAPVSMCPVTAP